MVNRSNLSCPQCLHENPSNSIKCILCDYPISCDNLDETRLPDATSIHTDPNKTIAPDITSNLEKNLDKTQAPAIKNIHSNGRNYSISEKQTFHFAGDLGHFEIHEILGQGGMGAVYHAKDKTLHRDVAIKMLRPLAASSKINTEALLDEARMASKLNHPNIVTIYDVARSKDSNYIVMEWVDGQALDELIPDGGMPLNKAMEYACQIADGLANAHQKYIIHRDIKPHNIMLSSNNSIKILDFGIAGYFDFQNDDSDDHSESGGLSSGTPSYMSPEQAQGLNLDQRSDIFSFGVVLYQMLCGKRPFLGKTYLELKDNICSGSYISIQEQLPNLPINLIELIDKMLAPAKDERWQNSAELAQALHEIYSELTFKKNWWQRRNWISKVAMTLPFILAIGWSGKEILFPASTQQLIERQLQEANKIAILPFENISGDPEIQLFGDGLAVNLSSDLSAIASHQGNTWIVPSTEISRMKDQTLKAVADKYGVNLVLTGSIQHMGSTRLLVLNLLNALTGQQVKTAELSIDSVQLFQGHNDIREQALELLGWTIPEELMIRFTNQRPVLDGAYKSYVNGQGYIYRYDQVGNLDSAQKAFETAIKIDKNHERSYVGLAEVYLNQFKKTEDVSWLNKMTLIIDDLKTINPNNKQINYLLAEIETKKGAYDNAIKLYKASIFQNKGHINSLIGLANSYNNKRNIKMAEQVFLSAINVAPNNLRINLHTGVFYFRNGEYEKAVKQFKEIIRKSPNNHYAYQNLAGSYYALGDIENAITFTKHAIKLRPHDQAYSNLGTMLFYIEKYDESITAFKKAIEYKDTNYLYWGNLADAYKLTHNNKSIESYENAVIRAKNRLKTNPKDKATIAAMSYYLANLQLKREALEYAIQIDNSDTGFENFFIATAYDQLGMVDESLKHLKYALDKNYPMDEIIKTPLLKVVRSDKRFTDIVNPKNN